MIPRWQMAGLVILAAFALGFGIYSSPNSYAHLLLTGQCSHDPAPAPCHPRGKWSN
jgi:hypothetical protein